MHQSAALPDFAKNLAIAPFSADPERIAHWHAACSYIFASGALISASKEVVKKAAVQGVLARIGRAGNRVSVFIKTLHQAKRFLRILFGFTLLVAGIAMIATPGPGWLTILLALGVLAAEFVWAWRLLERLKLEAARLRNTVFPPADAPAPTGRGVNRTA